MKTARPLLALAGIALSLSAAAQGATLIHQWKLDGDGTDSVGGVNLTANGGLTFTTGQLNQAVSLDGVDDGLKSGTITAIVPATDFTLTAWVYWEAGNGSRGWIAGGQNSGSGGEVFTMSRASNGSDRKLFANLLPNGGPSITEAADGAISDNTWQHVAITLDSSAGVTLYANGAVVQTNPSLTTPTTVGTTTTFTHPQNENPPGNLRGLYEWSPNLSDWYAGDGVDGPVGDPTVTIGSSTVGTTATVTAAASNALDRLFLRAGVTQD